MGGRFAPVFRSEISIIPSWSGLVWSGLVWSGLVMV